MNYRHFLFEDKDTGNLFYVNTRNGLEYAKKMARRCSDNPHFIEEHDDETYELNEDIEVI